MKSLYSKKLSAQLLLAFSVFAIMLAVAGLVARYIVSRNMDNAVKEINGMDSQASKSERILLLIHDAESDFKTSLLTSGGAHNIAYHKKLMLAFSEIDTLLHTATDTSNLFAGQYADLKHWYGKKLLLADRLYVLRKVIDSFMMVDSGLHQSMVQDLSNATNNARPAPVTTKRSDTLTLNNNHKKKKLFGRLKDAILNNTPQVSETYVQVYEKTGSDTEAPSDAVSVSYTPGWFQKTMEQMRLHNADMKKVQQGLVELDLHINRQLREIVAELDAANRAIAIAVKNAALKNYKDTLRTVNSFSIAALLLVLLFAVLLIVYLRKFTRSETLLQAEHDRAVNLARQKMDLLHHMSHEIRNPVSNIQGFLHIFSQSGLSVKQSELLSSISLSANLLLNTVNDVLAAAKMENSGFALVQKPFSPGQLLKEVVNSMQLSADQKNITMELDYSGDPSAMVVGDALRLEQVMVNLLSNAIKFTDKGGVRVKAGLIATHGKQELQVSVTDTGSGIAPAELEKLFTKYYRAGSASGKTGTGLGLYICKQFIELQGGKISVTSTQGVGSTFLFSIAYNEASTMDKENGVAYPGAVPGHGQLSVLVVDDNQLSLKFFKLMLVRSNVKLLFAENGREALDIVNHQPVSVIFSDIHMPVMDGFELLAAIRQLPTPLNNIPVIAMNGDQSKFDEATLVQKGFSAAGNKPILEDAVFQLISAVLR